MQEYDPARYAQLMGESPEYYGFPEPEVPPIETEEWLRDVFESAIETPSFDLELPEGWQTTATPEGQQMLITPEGKQVGFQDVMIAPSGEWLEKSAWEAEFQKMAGEQRLLEYKRLMGDVYLDEFITDIEAVMRWAQERPEEFRKNLLSLGRTGETEALLKYIGMSQEQVGEFYAGKPFRLPGEQSQLEGAFARLFPESITGEMQADLDALAQYVRLTPDAFLKEINAKGRSRDTEVLLQGLFPGISVEQMDTIFMPSFLETLPLMGKATEPGPPESKFKDIMDAFKLGADRFVWQSAKFLFSTLPNLIFQDVPVIAGVAMLPTPGGTFQQLTPGEVEAINNFNAKVKNFFADKYANLKQNEQKYYESVPELMPRPEWEAPVTDDPSRLKDPWYWAYIVSSNAAPMLAALATTVATAGAGAPAGLAMLAGAAVMTPSQSQSLYEELLANGADEQLAANMGVAIGALISAVEVAGDFPLLKTLSPTFMKLFNKEVIKQAAKMGMAKVIKQGLKTAGTVELSETLEEVIQQVMDNAAVKVINENKSLFEDLDDVAITAAIASLGFAGVGGISRISQLRYGATIDGAKTIELVLPDGTVQVVGQVKETEEALAVTDVTEDPELARQVMEWTKQQGEEAGKEVTTPMSRWEEEMIKRDIADLERKLPTAPQEEKSLIEQRIAQLKGDLERGIALMGEVPITPKAAIPKAEAGMPEAGLQPEMFGAPPTEIRPAGKGRITQISMAEQLRYAEMQRTAEIGGLKEWLVSEPATKLVNLIKKTGWYKGEVTNLTLKQYRDLTGKTEIKPNILTKDKKHVRWEYALDDVATEMGYESGEALKEAIESAGAGLTRIKKLEAQIPATLAEEVKTEELVVKPKEKQVLALRERIQIIRRQFKQKIETAARVKQILADAIEGAAPEVKAKMLVVMKNIKTDADLDKALIKLGELAEEYDAKALRSEIIAELKKAKPRKVEGILKGRFGVGAQELLDTLRKNVAEGQKLDVDTARAGFDSLNEQKATLMEGYDAGKVDAETLQSQLTAMELERAKFLNGMNSFELDLLLNDIQSIMLTGRTVWGEKLAVEEARLETIRTEVIAEVTGEKGIKPGEGVLSREELEKKRGWLQKLIDNQLGFGELMSELNIVKGKVEAAVNQFERQVQQSRNQENAGVLGNTKVTIQNFRRIFGLKNEGEANDLLNKMHNEEIDLGTFKVLTDEGVKYFNIKKSKAELLYHFIQLQDPTVEQTYYETMKWTPEITTAIVNNLTEQEVAWADYMKSFLQDYYPGIDKVYSDIYGAHLGNNPNYFPLNRDYESGVPENVMTFRDMMRYASAISGSLKARVASMLAIKDMDANIVLFNHIQAMEHFKAWSYTLRDLRRVFGNKQVKTAIRQYHGRDFVKRVDDYMNLMARGGVDKVLTTHLLDKLRGNFATAILTPKPLIALQQIPAIFAYWSQMPGGDFFTGVADFWAHPIEHTKWMSEHSAYIKARYSLGMERDIRVAERKNTFANWTGRSNFAKKLFLLIETGDKVGVFPGWWAKYKSALKHGLTEQQAMIEADIASNRTQNTSDVETLSAWQNGGSFWKLMTMFQNQPNKYFRLINENVRNIKYDRGSKAKAASIILLAWVILPGLYSIIGNAFRYKRDRFLKETAVAPINQLLIIGQLAQTIQGWLAKEPFEWRVSPVLDTVREIQMAIQKALKMVEQGKDPYEDLSIDDVIAFIEAIAKAGGQLVGIPTPYLIQVERAIRRGEPKELIWSQWALKTPEDVQTKINKFLAGLGLPIFDPNQPETPFSEKLPDIYDMAKQSSDLNSLLGHVLPENITAKNGYDPIAIAWAEMRKSREAYQSLPNVKLYQINTNLDEDDTIIQYYQQWQARQQIKSLPELVEFDKLYPKAYLGNVSREQYDLLVQYAKLETKAEQKAFLETHPTLLIDPREDWLKANPLDNARLAIWGQAKVLTQQAYDLAQKMVDELEIPADALDKYLPPAEVARDYFTYQELVSKYSAGDAEVKLLVAKNEALRDFLGREKIDSPINVLELQVKYRAQFDQWDDYADLDSELYIADEKKRAQARAKLLLENPQFADDRRRLEVYTKGGSDQMANDYLGYSKLVDKYSANSAEARLFKIEHPGLQTWAQQKETFDWAPLEEENIKSLKISVRWRMLDDQYKGMGDRNSPFYIPDETMRERSRAQLLKDNYAYADDRRRRDAYGLKLSDKIIEDYVTWFDIVKPKNYDPNLPWYDDDWYLMEHKAFYEEMVNLGKIEKKDFSKVPTREVFSLYLLYLKEMPGNDRMQFRLDHPELDDWLVEAGGYEPAKKPKKKEKTDPWDELRRKIWELRVRAAE